MAFPARLTAFPFARCFAIAWFLAAGDTMAAPASWCLSENIDVDGKAVNASLWIAPGGDAPRALLLTVKNFAEPEFCADPAIRATLARNRFALAYLSPNPFGSHDPPEPALRVLDQILLRLEQSSGISKFAALPLIPFGHSAAGPWARNLVWHKPGRMAAMIHFNSGQFVPPGWGSDAAKLVPILALNGEFEEFGPQGNHAATDTWEEQWLAMREQALALRATDHRVVLCVDPGGGHYCWNGRQTRIVAAFLDAVGRALGQPAGDRFPEPWLADADIKGARRLPAAPAPLYQGMPARAWWLPDRQFAEAWTAVQAPALFGKRRQTVRFRDVSKVEYQRDFLDPARVWDPETATIRVGAESSVGHPVHFAVIDGPVEPSGDGLFKLRRDRFQGGPGTAQKIRLRAWADENEQFTYGERVAELLLIPPAPRDAGAPRIP